jgi:hypothetical protein
MTIFALLANNTYSNPQENISRGVKYFQDSNQNFDIIGIQAMPKNFWQQEQSDVLSFAMGEHPYWLSFELAPQDNETSWLLELDYALLDMVSIWFINEQKIISEHHVGDAKFLTPGLFEHEKLLFPVPDRGQTLKVIIRVQSGGVMKIPLRLWQESSYLVYSGEQSIAMGLFFGFMAAMGLSNFFFFIITRLNTFLVYSSYVLCLALSFAALHGLDYKYLWPNSSWLQERSVSIFANATIVFAVIFTDLLLDVKSHSPRLSRLLKISAGLFLLCLVISLLLPPALLVTGFLFMFIMVILLIISVGIWVWIKGMPLAKYYTLTWIFLSLCGLLASLDKLSLITLDISYHYLLMIGASIETSLLALILALRYGQQRQDTFDAQELALSLERKTRSTQEIHI